MAVDIRDDYIGIALAYHRNGTQYNRDGEFDINVDTNIIPTTSISPLPPLPYMSTNPHHPSYSFRYRHRPTRPVAGMPSKPPRVERTMEVALQLAQLSSQRSVKSVLVRWPGGGAALGLGGRVQTSNEGVEGGLLSGLKMNIGHKVTFHGTLGYQRGKILYVLDKCCGVYGHNASTSSTLLLEGSRPFALWDTSDDQELITLSSRLDPSQQCEVPHSTSKSNERLDKFGNSIAEMDQWGRAPIFGMPPDYTWKHKQTYQEAIQPSGSFSEPQFDQFHDAEAKMDQLKGSFPAMLTLRDFANTHLEGRVALPAWVKLHEHSTDSEVKPDVDPKATEVHVGYRKPDWMLEKEATAAKSDVATKSEVPKYPEHDSKGKLATLVQMPRKRRRNREQSTQLGGRE